MEQKKSTAAVMRTCSIMKVCRNEFRDILSGVDQKTDRTDTKEEPEQKDQETSETAEQQNKQQSGSSEKPGDQQEAGQTD